MHRPYAQLLKLLLASLVFMLLIIQPVLAAQRVTVFAAASLADTVESLAERYERDTGTEVAVHTAASSMLVTQVRRGAPCDLIISADLQALQPLINSGRIGKEAIQPLLSNRLVAIGPLRSENAQPGWLNILTMDRVDRIVIGDPELAPAGRYAKAALEKAGVWAQIQPKIITTLDVRSAMALVAVGEAPVGIVYRTDTLLEKRVKVLFEIPPSYSGPITYPMAILSDTESPAAVRALAEFFKGPQAKAVFERFGFEFLP